MLRAGPPRRPLLGRDALLLDGSLAAAAATLGAISLHYRLETFPESGLGSLPPAAVSYGLVVGLCGLLAVRRVWPTSSFISVVAFFCIIRIFDVPEPTVTVVVLAGSYVSIGVNGKPGSRTTARACATVGFVIVYIIEAIRLTREQNLGESFRSLLVLDIAFSVGIIGSAWFTGEVVRKRIETTEALVDRTYQLEIERDRSARLAITDERLRIARELHDVLAHHVSVMGLQAVAADRVLDRNPTDARAALSIIERSSRAAVDEMRQLIGFLRADDDHEGATPQPSLARFDELVHTGELLGIRVEKHVVGDAYPLPPGVDLAAYRITQEAITNAHRHSTASKLSVTLDYRPGRCTLTLLDDGQPKETSTDSTRVGTGLIGMKERARLHEGAIDIGRDDSGGFRISATFPTRHDP